MAFAIFLISAITLTIFALPIANAHTPPWQIPTYAFIEVTPDPVGVGQQTLVIMWIDKSFGTDSALTNDWRFHNYNLTITKPDGHVETQIFSYISDPTSSQYIRYIPDQVGTYQFDFSFPGQKYTDYGHNPNSILVNDTFLPSSASKTLTVQQEPLPSPITSYPLPQEYWARPIYGENTDWWAISSNWLGVGSPVNSATGTGTISGFNAAAYIQRYPGDAVGPQTGHVMWTKSLQSGGVVGGNNFEIQGDTYFEGSAYNQRYQNPIILNGRIYYKEPVSFTGVSSGPTKCVDLRTGEVIWSRDDVPSIAFGYIYSLHDPNQHGVYPAILFTNNFARAFDADTGNPLFNVTGVPSGYTAKGPQGEHLRYVLANAGTSANPSWYLLQWNSSKLWDYSGLSPSIVASASITGGVAVNASTPNRYDWNVSIPWRNTMSPSPTIIAAFYNNMLIGYNGTLPGLTTNIFGTNSYTPYTYFAVNLNASRGVVGSLLWTKTYNAPPGNITVLLGGADPVAGVFVEGYKETVQWVGYSMATGEKMWGPTPSQVPFDYYGQPAYPYLDDQLAYGRLYSSSYGGILYSYDLKTGDLLWTYGNGGEGNSTNSGFYTAYGQYPTFIQAVGNDVIYLVTTEHTILTPIYKGGLARAVNATSGKEIWTLSDYTGEFFTFSYAIADGFSTFYNGYDNQIYSVGRGPSATTIQAPQTAITAGNKVVIQGKVIDISAGTKQNEQAARFPNGVPVASDASMKDWMGYVYQQKPSPANFIGVQVTIDAIDPNGNYVHIGDATTDTSGFFHYTWTSPNVPGDYKVYAAFVGSNGYWPSSAVTSMTIAEEAAQPTPTPAAPQSMTDTYVIGSAVAIIIVIVIIGLLLLRKK